MYYFIYHSILCKEDDTKKCIFIFVRYTLANLKNVIQLREYYKRVVMSSNGCAMFCGATFALLWRAAVHQPVARGRSARSALMAAMNDR